MERRQELRLAPRGHHGQAARLAPVAPDLRNDLRARDPERAGQARRTSHRRLHGLGDNARATEVRGNLADAQIPLVQPRPLDGGHDLAHRRPDLLRVLAVEAVPRANEYSARTAPERFGRGHRRVDPELPRLVVRGRDHPPPVRIAADDQGLRAELRLLELLDGSEERIEIEVRDDQRPNPIWTARKTR